MWPLEHLERDALLYFCGRLLSAIALLVAVVISTRYLGARLYGTLSLWLATGLWVCQLCAGWLTASIHRLHQDQMRAERRADYVYTVTALLGLTSGVAAIACYAVASGGLGAVGSLMLGAYVSLNTLFVGYLAVCQADLRAWNAITGETLRSFTLAACLGLAAVQQVLTIPVALAAYALSSGIGSVLMAWRVVGVAKGGGRFRPDIVRELASYGVPVAGWSFLASGGSVVGRLALECFRSTEELGVYSGLFEMVVKMGGLVFLPLSYAMYARVMASFAHGDFEAVQHYLRAGRRYIVVVGMIYCAVSILLVDLLCSTLFVEPIPPGIEEHILVGVLAAGVFLSYLGVVTQKWLELAKRPGRMVLLMANAVTVNALLSVALVPTFGPIGSATAYLAGNAVYVILTICAGRTAQV